MISVIVPCYNAASTVERCVESIIAQNKKPLEILLINDGSTDNTGEKIDEIQKKFGSDLIKVFHQSNQGVSKTRNFGIATARGSYISFIDADDFVEKNFLEELLNPYIEDEKIGLSVVGVVKKIESETLGVYNTVILDRDDYFIEIFKNPNVKGYPCNKLYKKDILINNDIFFDTTLTILEDLEFNLRYFKHINKIAVNNGKSYHYIILNNSAMTSKWSDKKLNMLNSFQKMELLDGLTKSQLEMIQIEKVRMLIWLIGQLYRTGSNQDISNNEKVIFYELKKYKRLFLKKGRYTGIKYYISYLFFTVYPRSLKILSRASK